MKNSKKLISFLSKEGKSKLCWDEILGLKNHPILIFWLFGGFFSIVEKKRLKNEGLQRSQMKETISYLSPYSS